MPAAAVNCRFGIAFVDRRFAFAAGASLRLVKAVADTDHSVVQNQTKVAPCKLDVLAGCIRRQVDPSPADAHADDKLTVDNGFLVLVGADNKLIVGMSDTVPEGFSDVSVQIGTFFIVPLFDKPEPAVEFVLSLPGRDFFIKKTLGNLAFDDDFRSCLISENIIQNVFDGFVSDSSVKVGKLRCEQNRRFLAHRSQSLDKRCLAAVAMPHVPADSTHTVSLCPQDLKILIRGVRPNHSRDF